MIGSMAFIASLYVLLFAMILAICRVEYGMPAALALLIGFVAVVLGTALGTIGTLVGFGFATSSAAVGVALFAAALGIAIV